MSPKVYSMITSPAARSVMIACDIFNVPAEMVNVNLKAGEHLRPEYLKLNPLHSVPVFQDGDFVIHDSHAILAYLSDTYGKDDSMYPKDPKKRSLVNQMLFFDGSTIFPRLKSVAYNAFYRGIRKVSDYQKQDILEAYDFLEEFLTRHKYLALDHLTIADIACLSNVLGLSYIIEIDSTKYPKIAAWIKNMENQPFYKEKFKAAAVQIGQLYRSALDL